MRQQRPLLPFLCDDDNWNRFIFLFIGNNDENSLEKRGILLEIFVLLLYNVFEY
jgi:hypothetical protein